MLFPLLLERLGGELRAKKMVADTCRLRYYYYVAVAIALAIAIAIVIVAYFWDFGHESLKSG